MKKINNGNKDKSLPKKTEYIPNNAKRILCYNMLNCKTCKYQHKCLYAHSLSEQKIDPIRHKVYTMLDNKTNLSKINLVNDKKLFDTFMLLTKVCRGCIKQTCTGGYNCREGAANNRYRICYDDIMYGTCKRRNCMYIHLTKRGLRPYVLQKTIHNNKGNDNPWKNTHRKKAMIENLQNKITRRDFSLASVEYNKNFTDNVNEITGIPLSDNFFLSMLSKKHHNDYMSHMDSDSEDEDVDEIIKYLNTHSDDDT